MLDFTILTVANDHKFLSLVRRQFRDQAARGSHMMVATTIDEASSLVDTIHPALIVVHWTRANGRYEQLDRLLWTTTVQARLIPVLVIADRYRIDQATMMYRMGVIEYISRTHHLDQFGSIFAAYLPRAPLPGQLASSLEPATPPGKPWSSSQKTGSIASQAV